MAQQGGSFLYKIKLALDQSGATSAFSTAIGQMKNDLRELRTSLRGTMETMERPSNFGQGRGRGLARNLAQMGQLKDKAEGLEQTKRQISAQQQKINKSAANQFNVQARIQRKVDERTESVLRADEATEAELKTQEELNDEAVKAANIHEDVNQERIRGDNITEGQANAQSKLTSNIVQTANAQEEVNSAMAAGNSRFNKTTQTSQNLLRILQDSQFGMMGMANNIQALGESLGRASTRGRTAMGQLKAGMMALLTGPMAIPALITAVTLLFQNLDKLPDPVNEFGTAVGQTFGLVNTKLEDAIANVQKLKEEQTKVDDLSKTLAKNLDAEGGGEAFTILGQRLGVINQKLARVQEKRERIMSGNAMGGSEQDALRNMAAAADVSFERVQKLSDAADSSREAFNELREIQQKASEAVVSGSATMSQFENNVKLTTQEINNLREQQEFITTLMETTNAESIKEVRARRRLKELTGKQGEELDILVDKYLEAKEAKEENNKKLESEAELRKRLADARIEAMDEGLTKQIKSIQLSIRRRRREVKAIEAQTEAQERQKEKILRFLEQIEKKRREAAVEEAQVEAAGLEGGTDKLFVPGIGHIDRDEWVERQTETFENTKERLDRRRQALRDERELGSSGIFEGIGSAQMQFQQRMLKKEQELREKRIAKELAFQKRMKDAALAAGDMEEAGRRMNAIAELQQQQFNVEKKWLRKRKNQYQKFLDDIINQYETTPVGDAVIGMTDRIGNVLRTFQSDQLKWTKMTQKQKALIISQSASQITGAASNIASSVFQTWREKRSQDLKDQGKSAEERRKIMKEEGKKRFQIMKAIKIANAITSGISATIASYEKGAEIGGPPVGAAFAATTAAAMAMKINQLRKVSIGDKFSGASGGSGESGGQFTQRSAASAANSAQRVGTNVTREGRKSEDKIEKTANRVGEEVARQMPDSVTMDKKTAEQANSVAVNRKNKLNK